MHTLLLQRGSVGRAASVHVYALLRARAAGLVRPSGALVQEHADSVLWKPPTACCRLVALTAHAGLAGGTS